MRIRAQGWVVVALGVFLASSAAAGPGDGINGTRHDLSTGQYAGSDPLNRICIFCHAPHNTYKLSANNTTTGRDTSVIGGGDVMPDDYTYLPLWNHAPSEYAAASFDMYENGPGAPQTGAKASQAILMGTMEPGGTSMLCLSCHDGSIAVNAYGNSTYQLEGSYGAGDKAILDLRYLIGKDRYLGNHHPIGFSYLAAQADDTGLRVADTLLTPDSTIADHLYGEGGGQTQMECGTCHSVHNTGNGGETLLWRSDQNSELCLTCHDKGEYTAPE